MDTLTHALSGALLARVIAARMNAAAPTPAVPAPPVPVGASGRFDALWNPGAGTPRLWTVVVAGAVAGAFPDVDAVVQWAGELAYLRHHRGVTHSLLLAPLWAWGLAVLAAWLSGATRGLAGGWKVWYPVMIGGVLIHIAGDWITGFGTMLLAPVSDHRFALGTTFIIDLTLSGLMLAGLIAAAMLPRRRWPAALALSAGAAWEGVAWVGQQEAIAAGQAWARERGLADPRVQAMARPASPFNWTVVVREGADGAYHLAHLNTRRTQPLVATADDSFIRRFSAPYQPLALATWERVEPFGGDAATRRGAREAFERPEFAFYRWFAQAPVLEEVTRGVPGERSVAADGAPTAGGGSPPAVVAAPTCYWFRDLRFGFPGRGDTPFRYGVCLGGEAGAERTAEVWSLDRDDGRPARVVGAS